MKKYFILMLALSMGILTGCGPIYNTEYSYKPPKSQVGVMCIATCEANRGNCRQMQDIQKENCEERADRDYHWCLKHKDPKECYRASCYADYSMCDDQYKSCYQGCGGTITATQVCVAFCK